MYYLDYKIEQEEGVYFTHLDCGHYVEEESLKIIKNLIYGYHLSGDLDFAYENKYNDKEEIEQEWFNMDYIQNKYEQ
jgi:hypothetical protein